MRTQRKNLGAIMITGVSIILVLVSTLPTPASAGMVWGIGGHIQGVATNGEQDIYLATPQGAFKIKPDGTYPPLAKVDMPADSGTYRPITASADGSKVALATEDQILLTDGDLQPLRELQFTMMTGRPDELGQHGLHLSEDGSRLYVKKHDLFTGFRTSDGKELWSIPCHGLVSSTAFSSKSDIVGYTCTKGSTTTATIVDGATGVTLWQRLILENAHLYISEGGRWIQIWTPSQTEIFEFPSPLPAISWDKGLVSFLSEDDQFVRVYETSDDLEKPVYRLEWYSASEQKALPELTAVSDLVHLTKHQALGADNQLLVTYINDTNRTPIDWQQNLDPPWVEDPESMMTEHSFIRFDRDGNILESGATTRPIHLFSFADDARAVLWNRNLISLFEPDKTNRHPVFGNPPCHRDGNLAIADITEPDGDEMEIYWNFSTSLWGAFRHGYDATGPSARLPESASDEQVSMLAVDEHGALYDVSCPGSVTSSTLTRTATGMPIWLMLVALLVIGKDLQYSKRGERRR